MITPAPMVELWRGPFLESVHYGHAVVARPGGDIVEAWGDPDLLVLPRSSAKMIQALPLVESGAADAKGLRSQQLALACASHASDAVHVTCVTEWLGALGLGETDLRCGPELSYDPKRREALIRDGIAPAQVRNNCSGKHSGFLTLAQHLGAGPEYTEIDHPVQVAVREAWERMTGETVAGHGIDGCTAPNFATSLKAVARAMANYAAAPADSPQSRLVEAMMAHPEMVAGEGRACTQFMRAIAGKGAVKTGAEGFFIAILPDQQLGVALKISDGTTRASEVAMAALLVKLGALDPDHPTVRDYIGRPILNHRGLTTGHVRVAPPLC